MSSNMAMQGDLLPEMLSTLLQIVRTERDVEVAVLFGSAVAGRLSDQSDIDLYLRLRPGVRWTHERQREQRWRFAEVLRRNVDLVIEDRDATSVILRREVARKGRVIFEATPGAWTRLKAEAMIAYGVSCLRSSRRAGACGTSSRTPPDPSTSLVCFRRRRSGWLPSTST